MESEITLCSAFIVDTDNDKQLGDERQNTGLNYPVFLHYNECEHLADAPTCKTFGLRSLMFYDEWVCALLIYYNNILQG